MWTPSSTAAVTGNPDMSSMVRVGGGGDEGVRRETSVVVNGSSRHDRVPGGSGTLIRVGHPNDSGSNVGYSPRTPPTPPQSPPLATPQSPLSPLPHSQSNPLSMPINSSSIINIDMLGQHLKNAIIDSKNQKKTPPPVAPKKLSVSTPTTSLSSPPQSPRLSDDCVSLQDSLQDSALGSMQEDGKSVTSDLSDKGSDISLDLIADERQEDELKLCSRVAVYRRAGSVVALKLTCHTEEAGNDPRLWQLIKSLVEAATTYFLKNMTVASLNASQVCKLRLGDGRLAKEHLAELSRTLNQSLTIVQAQVKHEPDDGYIGMVVHHMVHHYPYLTIAQHAALVVLLKVNKYAPLDEFADQLCEHILRTRPAAMGDEENIWRALQHHKPKQAIEQLPRNQLLAQTFLFDPTITVLEAAKRCFAKVINFELL